MGAATYWVENLQEGAVKERAMAAVVSIWADDDPNAAGEWLNTFPVEESLDRAVNAFARRMVDSDPETAVAWAETIVDPEIRAHSLTRLARLDQLNL